MWSKRWDAWQEKLKYSQQTSRSAALSTINPIWYYPGSNPGRYIEKLATNRLSYGTAQLAPSSRLDVFQYLVARSFFDVMPFP
jgi:hypothetical protein